MVEVAVSCKSEVEAGESALNEADSLAAAAAGYGHSAGGISRQACGLLVGEDSNASLGRGLVGKAVKSLGSLPIADVNATSGREGAP